jgi:segregation and condensation protein A
MPQHIHLKQFDGPLDLLLHLISKAKVDIRDIFVSEITEQYIASVSQAEDIDMDDASEFLAMAATLLEIKSRALLPRPPKDEDEEDPEQALIRQLEEYKRFKETAENLQAFEKAAAAMYMKLPEEYPLPPPSLELNGLTLNGLMEAFARILNRRPEEPEEAVLASREIRRDSYTIQACMGHILKRLRRGSVGFESLFSAAPCREEVVTLFLALLEVLRLGRAHIDQSGTFGEIILHPGRSKDIAAQ